MLAAISESLETRDFENDRLTTRRGYKTRLSSRHFLMRLLNRLTFTGGPFRLLPFMERMELNDPITISNEYHFCEVGNRLALVFLNASRDAAAVTDAQSGGRH